MNIPDTDRLLMSKIFFLSINSCFNNDDYFPNIEAYFDTQKSIYYFKEDGEWVTAEEIPEGYRGYSVNNRLNVIVTDYDDETPYQLINIHKKKYPYTSSGRIRTVSTD